MREARIWGPSQSRKTAFWAEGNLAEAGSDAGYVGAPVYEAHKLAPSASILQHG